MTDSIFDANNPDPGQPASNPPTINLPASVQELVGPGKKYATAELALEALVHAQQHIATLESDNRALKEKAEKAVTVEDVHKTVQDLLKAKEQATPANAVMDEAAMAALLDRQLTARERQQTAAHNTKVVKDALAEKFGDKAEEMYKQAAQENGLSLNSLNAMIAESPKAALKLLGLESAPKPTAKPSVGSVNTAALQVQPSSETKPKSVMAGATAKEMAEHWAAIKKRHLNP